MATKQQLITNSFEDIGLDSLEANQISRGLRELKNFCLSLENGGVFVGYNNTDPNLPADESGISQVNEDCIVKNIAVRLALIYDVVLSPVYLNIAKSLLEDITPFVLTGYQANPMLPNGMGDKLYNYEYFYNDFQYPEEICYVSVGDVVNAEKNLSDQPVDANIVSASWSSDTSTVSITNESLNGLIASATVSFSAEGTYLIKISATYDNGETIAQCLKYSVSECRKSPNQHTYFNNS